MFNCNFQSVEQVSWCVGVTAINLGIYICNFPFILFIFHNGTKIPFRSLLKFFPKDILGNFTCREIVFSTFAFLNLP